MADATGLIYLLTGFISDHFSPKQIAKIVVVTVLTLSSLVIGRYVMPRRKQNLGHTPLELSTRSKLPLALIAGSYLISAVSAFCAVAVVRPPRAKNTAR